MDKPFEAYSVGLVSASACSSLSPEETEKQMNAEHPTGIGSDWTLADDEAFSTGQPNPCPCEISPETHTHYLFHC